MDVLIEYVEVEGKKYKLQHPGNREVLKLRSKCINPQTGIPNLEPMLDYCFEHVVIPEGHGFRPTIDNIHPKEFEKWFDILPRFLRRGDAGGRKAAEEGTERGEKAS